MKSKTVEERYLQNLPEKTYVKLFLVNGIRLDGIISEYDKHCMILENQHKPPQLIYKEHILTLSPSGVTNERT